MFVPDWVILTDVAACLKVQDAATLTTAAPYWGNVVNLAHQQAYNLIVRKLTARGYLAAQIALWDDGAEFERVLALYWSLVEGGGLTKETAWAVDKYEQYLKDLDTELVTTDGVAVFPQGTAGQCTAGDFDTSRDIVSLDPGAPGLGRPARF